MCLFWRGLAVFFASSLFEESCHTLSVFPSMLAGCGNLTKLRKRCLHRSSGVETSRKRSIKILKPTKSISYGNEKDEVGKQTSSLNQEWLNLNRYSYPVWIVVTEAAAILEFLQDITHTLVGVWKGILEQVAQSKRSKQKFLHHQSCLLASTLNTTVDHKVERRSNYCLYQVSRLAKALLQLWRRFLIFYRSPRLLPSMGEAF